MMVATTLLTATVALGAGCGNHATDQARKPPTNASKPSPKEPDPKEPVKKEPAMTTKQILFYEDDKLIDTDDFASVPESIRYVEVNGVKVEVAKVVARTAGNQRSIEQYSADGVMLRRTLQLKDPK